MDKFKKREKIKKISKKEQCLKQVKDIASKNNQATPLSFIRMIN